MLPDKIEIRVTRPGLYPRECSNPEFQQGYFFTGKDYMDAKLKAEERFPHESLTIGVTRRLINGVWVKA